MNNRANLFPKGIDAILHRKNGKYRGVFDESDDFIKSITGLESSDGAIVIGREKSALFVDGRYKLAAELTVDPNKFEILNLKNDEIIKWMDKNLPPNGNIACDGKYYTHREMEFFADKLKSHKFISIDLEKTLNSSPEKFDLGFYRLNEFENKLFHITDAISENNLDAYLICDPCAIAWLLNIRDLNRKYAPIILCRLLVAKQGEHSLYLDDRYNTSNGFKRESDLPNDMLKFSRIGADKSQTPFYLKHSNFIDVKNPLTFPKSIKSKAEIEDIKLAVQKDSVAIIDFLHWFHSSGKKITELDVAKKLLYFRERQDGFIGESFPTIAAADKNAAIVHYSPTLSSNKSIDNILLVDSGGQYKRGTTDITRTLCRHKATDEQRFFYTLTLKGHIALANAKFPTGTTGSQLDPLARQFLWKYAKDYDHSTGHGVGYMSQVHEDPIAISRGNAVPLQSGMVISNEPGYYLANSFGIRLENMMLVKDEDAGFLSFETLSLIPFDRKLIEYDMLTQEEINWIKKYNQKIISTLKLDSNVLTWLLAEISNFI
ncbi:MAG: aminopeptidase P family protein [Holosporaceae bacterium]|jgi:Xaa-Pro aminopeptidase|nr:aminopeptidase P family protein [Holosporaceae bacterium]